MPQIVIWSWELGPDLSPPKALAAYREVLKGDPCAYCGSTARASVVDHIVPRALAGADEWANLTAACRDCNAGKGHRPLVDFLLGTSVHAGYLRNMERRQRGYEWMAEQRRLGLAA